MTRKATPLSEEQIRTVLGGVTLLRWMLVLWLLPTIFNIDALGAGTGVVFWMLQTIGIVLGIAGTSKVAGALRELLPEEPRTERAAPESSAPTPLYDAPPTLRPVVSRIEQPKAVAQATPHVSVNWEEWVGKKLLQKLGIAIVLIGMLVFLKYSFDNRLIGELGRIALSTIVAIGLLVCGEVFQRKYSSWAQGFTGGGLGLLYFTVWAAHVFYRVELLQYHGITLSPGVATTLYAAITAVGAMAAVRYKAQTIAWFSVLCGYLTPLLVNAPHTSEMLLAVYLAVLAGGILALAWHQQWPALPLVSFFFTNIYLFSLVYPSKNFSDARQILLAIGFFIVFALPPLLAQFRLRRKAQWDDLSLILADGVVAFVAVLGALGGYDGGYTGLICLSLATIYTAFAVLALRLRGEDGLLANAYLLSSILLIALALLAEMTANWVAAGWAPLSVLIALLAQRLQRRSILLAAIALLIGALIYLCINLPMFSSQTEALWHPFTSHWALLSYVVLPCVVAWIALGERLSTHMAAREDARGLVTVLHAVAAIVLFAGITFEATGLRLLATLPLAFAHLGFAVFCVAVFAYTGIGVWFAAAVAVQCFVLLCTFLLGDASGMVWSAGQSTPPIWHPWAAVSLLCLLSMGGLIASLSRQRDARWRSLPLRGILIGIGLAQVWLHVSVELQHMAVVWGWTDVTFSRALTAWWSIFTLPLFLWGVRKGQPFLVGCAIALLWVPFGKDMLRLIVGSGSLVELAVWTCLPLLLIGAGARLRDRTMLLNGCVMLGLAMAVDMLTSIAARRSLLRTIWWACVGLGTMSMGFALQERAVRRLSMGIFAATVIKLLLLDFSALTTGVRILASISTGLLLIGASYLYQRLDTSSPK